MDCNEFERLLHCPTESLLRGVLDASPVAASLALDGRIAYANPQCALMWGFHHPTQMKGVPFFTLIAPEWHPLVMALWQSRREGTGPWEYELEGVRTDGSRFAYRCTSVSFEIDAKKATFAYFTELDSCESLEVQMGHLEKRAGGFEPRQP